VYGNAGDGTFAHAATADAGDAPTGLSVSDLDGDGALDLLIGNGFGDVLVVLGDGRGGFRPFVRADQRVPFVATDLNGDGQTDVVLAEQARDRAGSMLRVPGSASFVPGAFRADGSDGLIGPGDVAEADLDGRYGTDLVFANSGSNNVLVYLRRADGGFESAPRSFFVGTNPVDLEVAQLNDDNGDGRVDALDRPDLAVANQGSNDVNVLLGAADPAGGWMFRPGPRLRTGGTGPNSVTARDLTGDGVPDLMVTNGQDGTLTVLPGIGSAAGPTAVGTGFFDDTQPRPRRVAPPTSPIVRTLALPPVSGRPQRAVALTQAGGLVAVDLSTFATAPAAPGFGRLVTAVGSFAASDPLNPFPLLIAAGAGFVSILTTADGVTFVESQTLFEPSLAGPSALEVLQGAGGAIEVYVTDAGEGVPLVLRFGPDDVLPTDPGGDPGGPDLVVAPLGGAPLAVVPLLVSGLPGDPSAPSAPGGVAPAGGNGPAQSPTFGLTDADPSAGFDGGFEAELARLGDDDPVPTAGALVLLTLLGDPSGSEEEGAEGAEPDEPTTLEQFVTGLEESLRRLFSPDASEPSGDAAPSATGTAAPPGPPAEARSGAPCEPGEQPRAVAGRVALDAASAPAGLPPATGVEPSPFEGAGWAVDLSAAEESSEGAGLPARGWDKPAALGAAVVLAGAAYRGWGRGGLPSRRGLGAGLRRLS
jgi:hypothetical protein